MNKFSLCTLAFLLTWGNLVAGGIIPVSRWKTHPMQIDGNDRDWDKPINFYDAKTGLFFAIANDSSTLYLNFTATDQQKMQNLMNAGWTLSFSVKNKKSKTKASLIFEASRGSAKSNRMEMDGKLNFPMNGSPDNKNRPDMQENQMPDASAQSITDSRVIMDYVRGFHSFRAQGFIFTHDEVPIQNHTGIVVRAGQADPAGLLYEIAIPLNELFEENSVRLDELINMMISVNASARPDGEMSSQPKSGDQGPMPGGGGRPGGMPGGSSMGGGPAHGGDMGGERPGNMESSAEKVIFKQKFRLTSK